MPDPDYKALCAELIEAVLSDDSHIDCVQIARGARTALAEPELCNLHREMAAESVARRARAALAQPEPVAPTDEEIMEVFWEHQNGLEELWADDWPAAARAVLARWGTPANTTGEEN